MPDTNTPDLEQQLTSAAEGVDAAPASSSAPPPAATSEQSPSSQTAGVPPSSASASPAAAPRQQVTPTEQNVPVWRRMAQEHGMQLPDTVDEATVLKHLFQGTRQAQQLQRQMQEITPYFSEFQKWRQQQAEAEAAKKNTENPWYSEWWNPPEFDPAWKQQITKDLEGNFIPAPGAPPDVVQKYLAYEQHRQQTADKFMTNPFEYMKGAIETLAEQKARAVYESIQRQQQEQQFIQQTVNAPEMGWIYDTDEKGQTRRGVDGQPLLSQWGNVYKAHVQQAFEKGWGVQDQHEWALARTQAAYALAQTQAAASGQVTTPQATPREQANARLYQQHEHAPNVGGVVPGPAEALAPVPNAAGVDLRDKLTSVLQNETDSAVDDFRFGRRSA